MPALASCSLDSNEPCTASILDEDKDTLQEKLVPSPLMQIQKADAFQLQYRKPYYDELINTMPDTETSTNNYNSNCQFGVCLPGLSDEEGEIVE